jgi:hypothetical protein
MTTTQPGLPTPPPPTTPAASRPDACLSRSGGAKTPPNHYPTAQNKPNPPTTGIGIRSFFKGVYDRIGGIARSKNKPNSNPIGAAVLSDVERIHPPGPLPSQLSNLRSQMPGPTHLPCHHPRQTNPISPVSVLIMRIAPKNKPNQSQSRPVAPAPDVTRSSPNSALPRPASAACSLALPAPSGITSLDVGVRPTGQTARYMRHEIRKESR